MMKLRKNKAYEHEFFRQYEKMYGEKYSKRNIRDFLFEDMYGDKDSYFYVSHLDYYYVDSTVWHRINMLWAWPLTLILAPFMYLAKGEVGWSENSRFGKWILEITGHIRKN